ncbi:MAG TPA: sigma-70 family RNA polymerase sigma factor [Polyangiaceae bacterium]|nr:sigma-70 family RNA polymerase sigma factor [Polyangiaceae bacterium]
MTVRRGLSSEPPVSRDPSADKNLRIRQAFEQNLDLVWRMLRRLGVPEALADDAAQHVFIVLSRRLDDVEPGSERSFLLSTAARVASEMRRSLTRKREVSGAAALLGGVMDQEPLPDEMTERRRASKLLDQVLDRIEESVRVVFVLYEFVSLTVPEIAKLLGIPLGTAASRLRRGRAEFKTRVAELELSLRGAQ